jgi:DNA polymerase III subunit beta
VRFEEGEMEFTVNKEDILKELTLIQGVVEKKNTIPILSNVLIESNGGEEISIIGTDLDVSLRTRVQAQVAKEGAIVVSARKLFDIVRSLPNAPIHLRQESNDWVTIECERSNFKVVGQSREHFPAIPAWTEAQYRIPSEVIKTLVGRTIFAITQEESRYTLNGALFRLLGGDVRMVATDGHRLAYIEKNGLTTGVATNGKGKGKPAPTEEVKALIPKKALAELLKLAGESDDAVEFAKDENHLFFRVGERILISRMLSGQFPNYELVMPKDNDRAVKIEGARFQSAIRRVALMADERSRAIKLLLAPERLDITSQSSEVGEARETLLTDYTGPDVTIGFNAQYISDFLNVAGEGEVRFEFKDGQSQAQLRPGDGDEYDYRYVVMPMRL